VTSTYPLCASSAFAGPAGVTASFIPAILMAFSPAARAWRDGGGDPAARLLFLRADPLDTLDRESGPATFLGDLAVLLHDEAARWLIALETAENLIGHAAVGAH
jgi:hypothetical protein